MNVINEKYLNGYYRNTRLDEGNGGKHDGNNIDYADNTADDGTPKGYQFEYPTPYMVRQETVKEYTSGGSKVQFFHDTKNGIACRTVHCHNFATNDKGDGSTGYHMHITFFMGNPTPEYMQNNRKNAAVTYTADEIDAKLLPVTPPAESSPTEPKPAGGTFIATRSGKSTDNGTFTFDEKYYNDFKDLKQAADAYDITGQKWLKDTTWTSVSKPSSNSAPADDGITECTKNGVQVRFYTKDWNNKSVFKDEGSKRELLKDFYDIDDKSEPWLKGTHFEE